jgi:hypothetical protein
VLYRSRSSAKERAIKIVLDITRLVREGKLAPEEAERLKSLAARDTGALAINAMMSFGAVAVAAGILALNPTFATGAVLGAVLALLGLGIWHRAGEEWRLLGTASTVIGALLLAGGLVGLLEASLASLGFAAILLFVLAAAIRSAFLMALVPLALAGMLGSSTGYVHATYMLMVTEPTVTIAVFSLLALLAYLASKRVGRGYEGLALVFARVSLILVNFGFWVGSLWGDYPGESWVHGDAYGAGAETADAWRAWRAAALHLPDYVFVVAWAAAVVAVGVWAARAGRRWVVSTAASFGAINFYTQWFERLGAEPWAVILAGVGIVAIAVLLWRYNAAPPASGRRMVASAPPTG